MKIILVKKHLLILAISLVTLGSQNILAANIAHGKDLHDANCQSCHASLMDGKPDQIYTRADRRVKTMSDLKSQVTRCMSTAGASWPEDQLQNVVDYLNNSFYKL